VLGAAAIAFGIVGYLMHPPVSEEPVQLSVTEAVAALSQHDRLLVSVAAGAETDRRIYSTVCERPVFGARSPSQVYDLSEEGTFSREELASYRGVVIRLAGRLDPQYITVQVISEDAEGDEAVVGERLIAPIAGIDGLWVVSPLLEADDLQKRAAFLSGRVFTGALTSLAFIDDNIGSYRLEMNADRIVDAAHLDLGRSMDGDTFVLLTDINEPQPGHFRLPVAGSGDALFVGPFREDEALSPRVASGPLQGLMWAWDAGDQAAIELEDVLGTLLPARYGVIHPDETAADHNRKTTFGLKLFTGAGGLMILVSLIAFVVRRVGGSSSGRRSVVL